MLATLIPVSDSLRRTGATDVISARLAEIGSTLPPAGALALILIVAMAVTPFLNNAATVLVVAPIAAGFAESLGYRPEAFLMAVAIGAGCDFLTPIGHQCNTLVMGPGGYRFSDYPAPRPAAVGAGDSRRGADADAGLADALTQSRDRRTKGRRPVVRRHGGSTVQQAGGASRCEQDTVPVSRGTGDRARRGLCPGHDDELLHHQRRHRARAPISAGSTAPTRIAHRWPKPPASPARPGAPICRPARSTPRTASAPDPGSTPRA